VPRRVSARLGARTIADFGEQWTRFRRNDGFYGSLEVLADICEPLLPLAEVHGARVAEIGSGTGRIVRMLLQAGAAHVVALEPSAAYDVLRENVADCADRVECVQATGEALPRDRAFDLVVSIGVLHHIPDPGPVVAAARAALRPGGRCLVWLYGREGNRLYLALTAPLRVLTTRLPPAAVLALSRALNAVLCRRLPLPLRRYVLEFFARMEDDQRVLIIYDQLKPAYARYYTRDEAVALLAAAGLVNVRAHHRRGYSWTVVGTRP
jgi:SAM-dependent methyltransferase